MVTNCRFRQAFSGPRWQRRWRACWERASFLRWRLGWARQFAAIFRRSRRTVAMPGSFEAGSNLCRMLPSGMKVGLTLSVVILASLIPLEHWPAHGFLLAV